LRGVNSGRTRCTLLPVEYRSNNPFFAAEPGGRDAAPGPLALVQAFVNTREAERAWEALPDPESLRRWFTDRGILAGSGPLSEADVRRAHEAREALRALLAANNGGDGRKARARAVETLNGVAARAGLGLRFGRDGRAILGPTTGGADGALGEVLAAVHAGMEEGTWGRLKACRNPGCAWAFYDRSKNRSGRWCSMVVCGNRSKTRAYRGRKIARGA
jgi:predicted RNA-binding Zn ribbon-like protein